LVRRTSYEAPLMQSSSTAALTMNQSQNVCKFRAGLPHRVWTKLAKYFLSYF